MISLLWGPSLCPACFGPESGVRPLRTGQSVGPGKVWSLGRIPTILPPLPPPPRPLLCPVKFLLVAGWISGLVNTGVKPIIGKERRRAVGQFVESTVCVSVFLWWSSSVCSGSELWLVRTPWLGSSAQAEVEITEWIWDVTHHHHQSGPAPHRLHSETERD